MEIESCFVIHDSDKVGLVGRNGAGKSTLLKIIAGEISPHGGNITMPNEKTLGFLHQEMFLPKGKTVIQETLTAFNEAVSIEKRIAEINNEMAERTDYESAAYAKLIEDFSELNDRFSFLGGATMVADAERILKGLGFKHKDLARLTDEFSGGWQMRIELAKLLLQKPDYLLLDEPTNHLDIESIIWLEQVIYLSIKRLIANSFNSALNVEKNKKPPSKINKKSLRKKKEPLLGLWLKLIKPKWRSRCKKHWIKWSEWRLIVKMQVR